MPSLHINLVHDHSPSIVLPTNYTLHHVSPSSSNADFLLINGRYVYPVFSKLLQLNSDYFRNLLNGKIWCDANNLSQLSGIPCLEIDYPHGEFSALLKWLHTGTLQESDILAIDYEYSLLANFVQLFYLADHLSLNKHTKTLCKWLNAHLEEFIEKCENDANITTALMLLKKLDVIIDFYAEVKVQASQQLCENLMNLFDMASVDNVLFKKLSEDDQEIYLKHYNSKLQALSPDLMNLLFEDIYAPRGKIFTDARNLSTLKFGIYEILPVTKIDIAIASNCLFLRDKFSRSVNGYQLSYNQLERFFGQYRRFIELNEDRIEELHFRALPLDQLLQLYKLDLTKRCAADAIFEKLEGFEIYDEKEIEKALEKWDALRTIFVYNEPRVLAMESRFSSLKIFKAMLKMRF